MFSVVDRSSFSCVGSQFHARGSATEKALSPIRRRVRGTTRSTDDQTRSADHAGTSATDVSQSDIYSGVRPRSDLWTSKHNLYWILSATGSQCYSWRARGHTVVRLKIQNSTCRGVQNSLKQCQCGSWKTSQHGVTVVQTRQDHCRNHGYTR